mgnify:CR=1 FL=1
MPRTPNWRVERERLRLEIHAVTALQRNVGPDHYLSDLSLYATYLYCLAANSRGHIHMVTWNQKCLRQLSVRELDTTVQPGTNPRSFGIVINNLKDQGIFIKFAHAFIHKRQEHMRRYGMKSHFTKLPIDFELEDPYKAMTSNQKV